MNKPPTKQLSMRAVQQECARHEGSCVDCPLVGNCPDTMPVNWDIPAIDKALRGRRFKPPTAISPTPYKRQ